MNTLDKIMEINPFENQKSQNEPEKEKKVEYEKDEAVEKTLEQYSIIKREKRYLSNYNEAANVLYFNLTPEQINISLQRMMVDTPKDVLEHSVTGMFLSHIIQKSYDGGHNDFVLNTMETQIPYIGYGVKGTRENHLKITVKGNAGDGFGCLSKECVYNAGKVKSISNSFNCIFNIDDIAEPEEVKDASNCTFITSNKELYDVINENTKLAKIYPDLKDDIATSLIAGMLKPLFIFYSAKEIKDNLADYIKRKNRVIYVPK